MTFIIWAKPTDRSSYAAWLEESRIKPKYLERQSKASLFFEVVKYGIRNMTSLNVSEPDRFRGIWYKKLSKLGKIVTELQKKLESF